MKVETDHTYKEQRFCYTNHQPTIEARAEISSLNLCLARRRKTTVNCYKFLTEQKHEMVMSKQLLRCGTSIGANTRESKNAQSRMDFLNKLNIALKEADETEYWLDLLHETQYLEDNMYKSINDDCGELIRILTSIIKKIKDNPQGK